MRGYRDDLDAAHQRIGQLEEQLAERPRPARRSRRAVVVVIALIVVLVLGAIVLMVRGRAVPAPPLALESSFFDETRWLVAERSGGITHPTPWHFHRNGRVEAPGFWKGFWRSTSRPGTFELEVDDKGSVDRSTLTIGPGRDWFSCEKDGRPYRHGTVLRRPSEISFAAAFAIENTAWDVGEVKGGPTHAEPWQFLPEGKVEARGYWHGTWKRRQGSQIFDITTQDDRAPFMKDELVAVIEPGERTFFVERDGRQYRYGARR